MVSEGQSRDHREDICFWACCSSVTVHPRMLNVGKGICPSFDIRSCSGTLLRFHSTMSGQNDHYLAIRWKKMTHIFSFAYFEEMLKWWINHSPFFLPVRLSLCLSGIRVCDAQQQKQIGGFIRAEKPSDSWELLFRTYALLQWKQTPALEKHWLLMFFGSTSIPRSWSKGFWVLLHAVSYIREAFLQRWIETGLGVWIVTW